MNNFVWTAELSKSRLLAKNVLIDKSKKNPVLYFSNISQLSQVSTKEVHFFFKKRIYNHFIFWINSLAQQKKLHKTADNIYKGELFSDIHALDCVKSTANINIKPWLLLIETMKEVKIKRVF